jgi:Tol biopolymer transport system component
LPLEASAPADVDVGTPIALPTGRGFSPRLGPDYLLYVSSTGTGLGMWKLADDVATEIWSSGDGRIIGGPEIAPDGRRVAFSVAAQDGKTRLYVMNADGTNLRVVSDTLELQGSPSWTIDGHSLTSGAITGGTPQLAHVTIGGAVVALARHVALDPAWSPDGTFVAYSGGDIGTAFPVKAAAASGASYPIPPIMLTRGARRLRFGPHGHALIVMRGNLRHKNLWLIDLDTGTERQLTDLPADFVIRDFDVSRDGREVVVERVQEHSDVVLIELARLQ